MRRITKPHPDALTPYRESAAFDTPKMAIWHSQHDETYLGLTHALNHCELVRMGGGNPRDGFLMHSLRSTYCGKTWVVLTTSVAQYFTIRDEGKSNLRQETLDFQPSHRPALPRGTQKLKVKIHVVSDHSPRSQQTLLRWLPAPRQRLVGDTKY